MKLKSKITLRLSNEQLKMIGEIIQKNPHKYESISHIIRIGIIKLWREETKDERKPKTS